MPKQNNQNKIGGGKEENFAYVFPKSEEITIHKSDLQIQLEKFKERIRSAFSIFDLLAVLSLWSPLVTADFKSWLGISSDNIRAGYVVFAILITIFIFWSRLKYFVINFWKKESVSSDSEVMAKKVLEQCQSKIKK